MSLSLGETALSSKDLEGQIDALVKTMLSYGERIQGVQPPQKELLSTTERHIAEIGQVRSRPLFYNYLGSGLGRGAYVELQDGSVKLDLINGIGVHILGHSHPKVLKASVHGALTDTVIQGNLQPNGEYLKLSEKLKEIAGRNSRLKYVWLATCGTIANENALKMARQKTSPARMIITFKNAFAGRSTMMAEITENPNLKNGLPEYHEVLRLPFYDRKDPASKDRTLAQLKEHVAKHEGKICVFAFEPMLGEGGYKWAGPDFFLPLLDFCKSKKIPIWADEVQTFTRTGNFFAYETLGFGDYVDMVTIAKTAQNGATLFTEEMKPDAGLLGGTFSGSGATLAAGLEILNILDSEGYMGKTGKIQKIHDEFVGMLNELNETTCKGLLTDAGGLGLMVAVTPFDGSKEKQLALLKTLFKNGMICFGCGSNPARIRFLLPAILQSKDIQVAKQILEQSIQELA